ERPEVERLLTAVGFFVAPKDGRLAVQVPGWRPDVTREVDLIEEVARLKGYDAFPDELRADRPGTVRDAPDERARARVREQLVRAGLLEARTLPLGPPDGPDAVPILNPMSAEEAYLRRRLLPGLARRIEYNWANRNRDIRLFEVGTVFRKTPGGQGTGTGSLPDEWTSVAGVLTGARRPAHWSEGAKLPDMDIWDLKYHFELAVAAADPSCTVGPLLERLEVFDEYRGPGIAAGHRSVAWHCTFRDPERTLRERDVDALLARGLEALEGELGVRRRES